MYMIMSSADHDSFTFYFFLSNFYAFYFSCQVLWLELPILE